MTRAKDLQHLVDHVPVHNIALPDSPALRRDCFVVDLSRLGALGAEVEFAPVAPTSALSTSDLPGAIIALPPVHTALPPGEEVVLELVPLHANPGSHRLPLIQRSDEVLAHDTAQVLHVHRAEQCKVLQLPSLPFAFGFRLCGKQVLAKEGLEAGVRNLAQSVNVQELELRSMRHLETVHDLVESRLAPLPNEPLGERVVEAHEELHIRYLAVLLELAQVRPQLEPREAVGRFQRRLHDLRPTPLADGALVVEDGAVEDDIRVGLVLDCKCL
mmetsp:Transcript_86418/g.169068  ORF Transcript_86418/g.169068 Transcript_86418/m.169068 type:complete len:272 (-) Transcript_86418:494-1309(-)